MDKVLDQHVDAKWTSSSYPQFFYPTSMTDCLLWAAVDSSVHKERSSEQALREVVHNPQDLLPLLNLKDK